MSAEQAETIIKLLERLKYTLLVIVGLLSMIVIGLFAGLAR